MLHGQLLRFFATMGPSATLSSSADFLGSPVIRFAAPPISRRDEGGFSSCLAHPCHRAAANTPPECLTASVSWWLSDVAFALSVRARPLEFSVFEATYAFTCVAARSLAHHPKDGFVDRLHSLRFLRKCDPSYRVLTLALVGLPPTEYASLKLDTHR